LSLQLRDLQNENLLIKNENMEEKEHLRRQNRDARKRHEGVIKSRVITTLCDNEKIEALPRKAIYELLSITGYYWSKKTLPKKELAHFIRSGLSNTFFSKYERAERVLVEYGALKED